MDSVFLCKGLSKKKKKKSRSKIPRPPVSLTIGLKELSGRSEPGIHMFTQMDIATASRSLRLQLPTSLVASSRAVARLGVVVQSALIVMKWRICSLFRLGLPHFINFRNFHWSSRVWESWTLASLAENGVERIPPRYQFNVINSLGKWAHAFDSKVETNVVHLPWRITCKKTNKTKKVPRQTGQ